MGTAERRARQRDSTRESILEAARELAAREGYDAVTVRRIAERIEYTPAALYRHYPSKAAIFAALLAADHAALARELEPHSDVIDPVERIRRAARSYVEFGMADLDRYRMMFMTPIELEDAAGVVAVDQAYEFFRRAVIQAISSLRLRPELTDAEIVTQAIWGALHGIVSLHAARTHDSDVAWRPVRQTAAHLIDTLLRGLARGRVG